MQPHLLPARGRLEQRGVERVRRGRVVAGRGERLRERPRILAAPEAAQPPAGTPTRVRARQSQITRPRITSSAAMPSTTMSLPTGPPTPACRKASPSMWKKCASCSLTQIQKRSHGVSRPNEVERNASSTARRICSSGMGVADWSMRAGDGCRLR
jgi:hypothetical protein